ncbi:hypothetical protein ACOME3_001404 [Neoechinorhynchus agilis]
MSDVYLKLCIQKCPDEELILSNCAIVHSDIEQNGEIRFAELLTGPTGRYVFTLKSHRIAAPGEMCLSVVQRRWCGAEVSRQYQLKLYAQNGRDFEFVSHVVLEVDYVTKPVILKEKQSGQMLVVDTSVLSLHMSQTFSNFCFNVGQTLVVVTEPKSSNRKKLQLTVKKLNLLEGKEGTVGVSFPNTLYIFVNSPSSQTIELSGDAVATDNKFGIHQPTLLSADFDFTQLGVGGVDDKFLAIFRQVFASRLCPPNFAEKLGIKHVKGILLYGPPGTGKTLMARQISKMLTARPAKIIDGPQVLDKYVGESEANIRKLFSEAEEEQKKSGIYSALHVIIFDEIDAICKKRGSMAGTGAGVHDTIVNQLLSKIDGVDELRNVLVIGMTNRKDMIDEALLRPGRLEVHLEIGLPDLNGRVQILNIHTRNMRLSNKLADDVDIAELAHLTKNFSGAELEALVKSATSTAINRYIAIGQKIVLDEDAMKNMKIKRSDFMYGLNNDVKPAFGACNDALEKYMINGIIDWSVSVVHSVQSELNLVISKCLKDASCPLASVLIEGPIGCGKTAMACKAAMESEFPFVKMCTPVDMIGFTEIAKSLSVKEIFLDAYKSPASCVILDNIEGMIEYAAIGPRFSNLMVQSIKLLLSKPLEKDRRLCVIGTTSQMAVMKALGIDRAFKQTIHLRNLETGLEVLSTLDSIEWSGYGDQFRKELTKYLQHPLKFAVNIGIKQLFDVIGDARQAREEYQVQCLLDGIRRISDLNLDSDRPSYF